MQIIDIKSDFGFLPPSKYIKLLVNGTYFQSMAIQDTMEKYLNAGGTIDLHSFSVKKTEYQGLLAAYNRLIVTHGLFLRASQLIQSRHNLGTLDLIPPLHCDSYVELLLEGTIFKRQTSKDMMKKYFMSKTAVSLKSCALPNASYSIVHASKVRVLKTHETYFKAHNLLTEILEKPTVAIGTSI